MVVVQAVVGSSPIIHPTPMKRSFRRLPEAPFLYCNQLDIFFFSRCILIGIFLKQFLPIYPFTLRPRRAIDFSLINSGGKVTPEDQPSAICCYLLQFTPTIFKC